MGAPLRQKLPQGGSGLKGGPLGPQEVDALLLDPAEQMAKDVLAYLGRDGLVNDGPQPGRLDIFTTGSAEEYAMKAEKVGLDPVTSVQFYPPMKL